MVPSTHHGTSPHPAEPLTKRVRGQRYPRGWRGVATHRSRWENAAGDLAATDATTPISPLFARWVAGLRYEDLPPEVVDRAKGPTLHAVASALLGSQLPGGRRAIQLIADEEAGAPNGASVIVAGTRATPAGAAFANAEMILAGRGIRSAS